MMALIKDVRCALRLQGETGLNYLLSRFPERYEAGMAPVAARSVFNHAIYSFAWALRRCFSSRRAVMPASDYLIYVGSINQGNSLAPTVKALRERGYVCTVVTRSSGLIRGGSIQVVFPVQVLFVGAVVLLSRLSRVAREVKAISADVYRRRLYTFLSAYFWLAYFCWAIREAKPSGILMSNDHSLPNRCLLYAAKVLGVETFYLQHASVSDAFPPLEFDVAFLDGSIAAETYERCRDHSAPQSSVPSRVILSGNKKGISRVAIDFGFAGLAVNLIDQPATAAAVACAMTSLGIQVKIRFHPALGSQWRKEFISIVQINPNILVDSSEESLHDFLTGLCCLVAGNSSIHLEAALAGVFPIYYALGEYEIFDYYGYVRNGLSAPANGPDELCSLVARAANGEAQVDAESIRAYSSTFGTRWEGREGELVARVISRMQRSGPRLACGLNAQLGTKVGGMRTDGSFPT